jgi:hypothetical protein
MMKGMSSKERVTLTLDHDLLAAAERAVRSGHARSVSAYINEAARRGAFVTVEQAMAEFTDRFGTPDDEHFAWARQALGLPEDSLGDHAHPGSNPDPA